MTRVHRCPLRVLFQPKETVSALWMWHTVAGYICAYCSAARIEAGGPTLASGLVL